jgi:hypothetical protein
MTAFDAFTPPGVRETASADQVWKLRWSIGVSVVSSPLLVKIGERPTLTHKHVADIDAGYVANPFLLRRGGLLHLFYEVWNNTLGRGEIAFSTSSDDGAAWQYGGVVLREPFHLSYPFVFEEEGEVWMVPESRADRSVRLYRAAGFPWRWKHQATLLRGGYADSTIVRHDDLWWLFAQRGLDELRLFFSEDLAGGWREHPANPLWPGNRRRTRPGGRVLRVDGALIRPAQQGLPTYGNSLRAFAIDRLDRQGYAEHELPGGPLLEAKGSGWTACAAHHLDAVPASVGEGWVTVFDGAAPAMF